MPLLELSASSQCKRMTILLHVPHAVIQRLTLECRLWWRVGLVAGMPHAAFAHDVGDRANARHAAAVPSGAAPSPSSPEALAASVADGGAVSPRPFQLNSVRSSAGRELTGERGSLCDRGGRTLAAHGTQALGRVLRDPGQETMLHIDVKSVNWKSHAWRNA